MPKDADIDYIDCFLRAAKCVAPAEEWITNSREFWCYVEPPGFIPRSQGWKIHVSATPRSAEDVLTRATEVLIRNRAAFKFAKGLAQLRELVSIRCDRGAGGKFLTVYPNDDDHFRRLAEQLHAATEGLPGPAILSDRPYRPGSLVHFRYGGFAANVTVLDFDGSYVPMLVAPDGSWVMDERLAWFSPPEWAPSPLPATPPRKPEAQRGQPVLLGGRFLVMEAIRHANRGGVYRATDQTTGAPVIVKQARPHVGADLLGGDATDFLRHEARMLELLEPLGLTPRLVSVFAYEGHAFLAEEQLDGASLREWVDREIRGSEAMHLPWPQTLDLARQLVALVHAVHEKGLVFRDFNPANVFVEAEGRLRLIDTEFLAVPGEPVNSVMTFGYAAPEQARAGAYGPAPDQAVDLYSLGGSLLFLCCGVHPGLPPDQPDERPQGARVVAMAEAIARGNPVLGRMLPVVAGLLADEPAERWSLRQAADFLDRLADECLDRLDGRARPGTGNGLPATPPDTARMIRDGLLAMARAAQPDQPEVFPPIRWDGRTGDPCSVQSGAAGPVEVFRRALQVRPDPEIAGAFEGVVRWLDRRLAAEPRLLPGLYFGRSGAIWSLYEASVALGDGELERRSLDLARRLPVRWGNPDITHGLAGSGMTQLHLWRRTGREEFRERSLSCAAALVEACERRTGGVAWPIPASFRSNLAGLAHYGFAHGVAGVSTFLLGIARTFDRADLMELALAGGEALLAVGQPWGEALRWPTGNADAGHDEGLTWWCSGSGGVGTFLIRLWRATGDQRFRAAAHAAALAVVRDRWRQTTVHCHGLASSGELLLDMAAATGDPLYLDWATEISTCLYARHTSVRHGLLILAGESPQNTAYSYNLGMAGIVGFLHRARHGGERWWMVDDFELPAADGVAAQAGA
ncbi:MAG TPA: class IV lanthionine synthetase LanL [Nonomuraea sp.]|nr:class IV lanthionine synthetase LanL [Nonomuraea sp.]